MDAQRTEPCVVAINHKYTHLAMSATQSQMGFYQSRYCSKELEYLQKQSKQTIGIMSRYKWSPKVTEQARCGNQSRVTHSPSDVINPISVGIAPVNEFTLRVRSAAQTDKTNH
jgi:hypothetical protein